MKRILVALVVLCLLLTGCGNSSVPHITSDGDPNVALEKYNALLRHWAYDKNFPSDTEGNFPKFFGGAYIEPRGNLVILVTQESEEVNTYFAELIDMENVVLTKAAHSYRSLLDAVQTASNNMATVNEKYGNVVTGVGMSVKENAVNIYIFTDRVKEQGLNVKQICKELTVFPNINLIETKGMDQPA